MIRDYQTKYGCRLIVVSSPIFSNSLVFLEELIHDCNPAVDLHVMMTSPGGDGETALRIARSLQARCKELTVVLPDQAKSAATLIALGAHSILMGPFGDLGPVDPQLLLEGQTTFVSAKDIIAAIEDATARIQTAPESYPLWASLFSNLNGIIVQQARAAIDRSGDQLREALAANGDRSADEVEQLVTNLSNRLIVQPKSHSAVFGAEDAINAGLPVTQLDPAGEQWREVWRLWGRYAVLGNVAAYEGERASQVFPLG
ncbi:MAG: SDH family Clp fold serine proteinase [Dehalococcoidia bacterium]